MQEKLMRPDEDGDANVEIVLWVLLKDKMEESRNQAKMWRDRHAEKAREASMRWYEGIR
jgi:hypothetical protein